VDAVVICDEDAHDMKITLIHNPGAGAGQDASGLVQLITEAGHQVRHRSTKGEWKPFLKKPTDLVVAAGGDGTVRRVALAAAENGLPFAVIPIGTANNIAKTIGLLGDAGELIESWSASPRARHPFDLGEVVAPWGEGRFVEGVGGGLIADLIDREDEVAAEAKLLGGETDRALHLLSELVSEARMRRWQIKADGKDLSGEYFSVEVLNIRFVGPNLPLAPHAFPGDGLLDVVLLGKDDRQPLLDYLEKRMHLASGQLPELRCMRARDIEINAPTGMRWHLDDKNWPRKKPPAAKATLRVKCLAGAATFVAAPSTERVEADSAAGE
jgi:diacylglycerol kinase family enzyme